MVLANACLMLLMTLGASAEETSSLLQVKAVSSNTACSGGKCKPTTTTTTCKTTTTAGFGILPTANETLKPSSGEQCISGVFASKKVSFSESHTVRLSVRMPAKDTVDAQHLRQWIFSAHKGTGAEHWLWSPTGKFGANKPGHHIQFGRWYGKLITDFEGSDETRLDILEASSLTTVYDADAKQYTLYMNGEKKQSIDAVDFVWPAAQNQQQLYVGVVPGSPNADVVGHQSRFTGCIEEVQVFDRDLLASEVAALSETD